MIINLGLMFDNPWVCQTCHCSIPAGVWHGIPDGCSRPMAEAPQVSATPCPECAELRKRVKTLEGTLKPFADAWVVYSIAARRDRRTTGVQQRIGWQPFQKAWAALKKLEKA